MNDATIWNIHRDYRLRVSQWGDDALLMIGDNAGGRLYDHEAAKRLYDAIGEIVEQIKPKTKTQRRTAELVIPAGEWTDSGEWFQHILPVVLATETREVPV